MPTLQSPLSDSAGSIPAKDAIATIGFSRFHTANNAIAPSGVSLLDSYDAIASIEGKPVQFRDKDAITALESKLFDSYDAIASTKVS
ncbi:hypothetical protein [Laspinema palackyanum]|uniref:hypothetical protein n=1 Tax=Laspinema palackyanum TaxID=3231601 RepID=UPI00345CFD79|nr:hypothetical protein [Laspinema sp. D2c]